MLEISEILISAADEEGEVLEESEECYVVGECNHNGLSPIVGIWRRRNNDPDKDEFLGRFYPDELIKAAKIIVTADYRRDECS